MYNSTRDMEAKGIDVMKNEASYIDTWKMLHSKNISLIKGTFFLEERNTAVTPLITSTFNPRQLESLGLFRSLIM